MQRSIARANIMNRTIATTRRVPSSTLPRATRLRRAVCETLEERQLMSLTITLREAGGVSSATAASVGQVITLDLLATITSSNGIPTQDALEDVDGSIV